MTFRANNALVSGVFRICLVAVIGLLMMSQPVIAANRLRITTANRDNLFPGVVIVNSAARSFWCYKKSLRESVAGEVAKIKGRDVFTIYSGPRVKLAKGFRNVKSKVLNDICRQIDRSNQQSSGGGGGFQDTGGGLAPLISGPSTFTFSAATGGDVVNFTGANFDTSSAIFLLAFNGQLVNPPIHVPSVLVSPQSIAVAVGAPVALTASVIAVNFSGSGMLLSNIHGIQLLLGNPATPTPTPTPTPPLGIPFSQLSPQPIAGSNFTVQSGQTIVLDVNPPALGELNIQGTLVVDPNRDIDLTMANLTVSGGGALLAGTEAVPYDHKFRMTFTAPRGAHTQRADGGFDNSGARGAMVMGSLHLFGKVDGPQVVKISDHILPGSTMIPLNQSVFWKAGDEIILTTTDFYGVGSVERFTVASDTNGAFAVNVTTPVVSPRWGKLQYPLNNPVQLPGTSILTGLSLSPAPGGFVSPSVDTPIILDERAEVANLTRHIVIQGADDAAWNSQGFGAHIMMMNINSSAKLDGVEFRRVGQAGGMGRYPFHWHMLSYTSANSQGVGGGVYIGETVGHFVRNSTIHDSSNRAITIHATNGVSVTNNIAFNIKGHAYFLEDGNERRNTISGNLAAKIDAPTLPNRIKVHDDQAAGFWITNPDNTVTFNTAVACKGAGVWNSFAYQLFGLSRNGVMVPREMALLRHEGNVAHGNYGSGIMTDFVVNDEFGNVIQDINRYSPPVPAELIGNVSFKNGTNGYQNRATSARYRKWVVADNPNKGFTGATIDAELSDSFLVGESLNNATPMNSPQQAASASYHFAMKIYNIVAVNFKYGPPVYEGNVNVRGGGFLDTADLYHTTGVALEYSWFTNWKLVNAHPGYLGASPYFDGFNLQTGLPQANNYRYWTLPGAHYDPYGRYGPAGNYVVPDHPYYTYGQTLGQLVSQPGGTNFRSMPNKYFGLFNVKTEPTTPEWSVDAHALRIQHMNANMTLVAGALHEVGPPNSSFQLAGFRNLAVANGSIVNLTFPGEALPTQVFRLGISNAADSGDQFILCVPWGASTVSGRIEAGEGGAPGGNQSRPLVFSTSGGLGPVIADASGSAGFLDLVNWRACVKVMKGPISFPSWYINDPEGALRKAIVLRLTP